MALPWWSRRKWMSPEYKLLLFGLRDMRSNDFSVSPPHWAWHFTSPAPGQCLALAIRVTQLITCHGSRGSFDLGSQGFRPQSPIFLIDLSLFVYSSQYPSQRDCLPQLITHGFFHLSVWYGLRFDSVSCSQSLCQRRQNRMRTSLICPWSVN